MPHPDRFTIKLPFGIECEAPRVAVTIAIVVLALGAVAYFMLQPEQQLRLVSERAANAAMRRDIAEYSKHLADAPDARVTLIEGATGRIEVLHYRDDCLVAAAFDGAGRQVATKLIADLTGTEAARGAGLGDLLELVAPTVQAAQGSICDRTYHGAVVRNIQEGRQGPLVWFRRWFQDGCEHRQPFDTSRGVWLAPLWIVCRHYQ